MRFETLGSSRSPQRELSESEKESLATHARSFDELYAAIDKIGPVQGSQEVFESERLKQLIGQVRNGALSLVYISRTYGLRGAVERLLRLQRPSPDIPPNLEAAAALKLPEEESSGVRAGETPEHPINPIEPLTDEERVFLNETEADHAFMNFGRAASDERERAKRYEALFDKHSRFSALVQPHSFRQLYESLSSAGAIKEGEVIVTAQKVIDEIGKVKSGEAAIEVLPTLLRKGVENLIAQDVFRRLEVGGQQQLRPHEWNIFLRRFPVQPDYLGSRSSHNYSYPKIGDEGVAVRDSDAVVASKLVWCDGKSAIFETAAGYLLIPFNQIILGNGKTLGEMQEEEHARTYLQASKPRARRIDE